ncbi:MAG: outer membrane beta-barrel protein [Longimicrobiales bacterium]
MKRSMTMMVVAGVALLGARPAAAQLGLGGGVTFPAGDLDDVTGAGWHVQGQLGFQPGMLPIGLRLDAGFQQLGGDEDAPDVTGDFSFQEIFGTLSAVLPLINEPGLAPYVLGGVGFYGDRFSFDDEGVEEDVEDWQTNFGLNGGVGMDIPLGGYNTFVEARYQHVFSGEDFGPGESIQTFPITFGLRF